MQQININELRSHPRNNEFFDDIIGDKNLQQLRWVQLKKDISTKEIQLCDLAFKKYGTKRYIADFVDPLSRTIIEIDGENHNEKLQRLKDELRELFFLKKGYITIRFTNQEVLNLFRLHCNVIAMEVENE